MATHSLYTTLNNGFGIELQVYASHWTYGEEMYSNLNFGIFGYGTASGVINYLRIVVDGSTAKEHRYTSTTNKIAPGAMIGADSNVVDILHNYDGTATTNIYVEAIVNNGSAINVKVRQDITLEPFDLTGSANLPAATIGKETTISVFKKNPAYLTTLTYTFGSLSGTIAEKTNSTSIKWTPPEEFYYEMPNSKTWSGTLLTETYDTAGNKVDTNTRSFTIIVDEEKCKPTLSPEVIQTMYSNLLGNTYEDTIIKYFNYCTYTTNAEAKYGASIKSYLVRNSGIYSSSSTGYFRNAEHNGFYFSVTDSRGIVAHAEVVLSMLNYVKPSCNLQVQIPNAEGSTKLKISGNWWNNYFLAPTKNAMNLQYWYSKDGETKTYFTVLASQISTNSNNTYTAEINITGLDYQSTYVFGATITDSLTSAISAEVTVKTRPIFDWGENDFNFNVPVAVNGDMNVSGNMEVAGSLTVNGVPLNAKSGNFGTWTPTCSYLYGTETVPLIALGNWMRIGDFCVINWYLEGANDMPPDVQNPGIAITGLPFTPDSNYRWQSGGGNAGNYYNVDDYGNQVVFTGWSIEGGVIYGRTASVYSDGIASQYYGYASHDYLKAAKGGPSFPFRASGTIMYKVAEGE